MSENVKLDTGDKLAKVRPFYYVVVRRCIEFRPNSENLSVDEPMLPYYGRNNSKQRIQNKPTRTAFKMWVLAEPLGDVVNFDPYQSAKCGNTTRVTDKTCGLGETVVLSLLDVLPQNICYRVFMDNVFTSLCLCHVNCTKME